MQQFVYIKKNMSSLESIDIVFGEFILPVSALTELTRRTETTWSALSKRPALFKHENNIKIQVFLRC